MRKNKNSKNIDGLEIKKKKLTTFYEQMHLQNEYIIQNWYFRLNVLDACYARDNAMHGNGSVHVEHSWHILWIFEFLSMYMLNYVYNYLHQIGQAHW